MATHLSEGKVEAPAERAQCDQSANEGRDEKEREPIQQLLAGHDRPVPGTPASAMLTRSGPKTARGKAAVAGNAIGHGIFAKAQVIPGVERAEEWDAHLAGVLSSLAPQDYLQAELARDVANQLWHLKRLERWEGALLAMEQAKVEPELAHLLTERAQRQGIPNPRGWTNEEQLEDEILLMEMRQIPLEKVADQADKMPFPLVGAQDLLRALLTMKGLDPADAPNPVQAILRSTQDSTLTAGHVLKAVQALAAAVGKEVPKMLRKLAKEASARKANLRELKAWARTQRSLLQEIHLLPDAEHAERLMRYRAPFTRHLYQALHELEALQARRRGEPTPLARIDVQGVPEVLSGLSDAIGRSSTRGDRSGVDLAQASANGSSTVVSEGSAG